MEVIREETEKREQYTGKEMGTCRFCGQRRLVRYAGGLTQEELDKIATDECNCDGAIKERNIRYETSKARTAVEKVIMPRYPEAGAILKEAADSTAHGLFHAVTIGLGDGAKARMRCAGRFEAEEEHCSRASALVRQCRRLNSAIRLQDTREGRR